MVSPLGGAWELVSDTHQGLIMFTDSQFSGVVMTKGRQASEEPSETVQNVSAVSGPYTIAGSTATVTRLANLHPQSLETKSEHPFSIEGDTLTWRAASGDLSFKRVS